MALADARLLLEQPGFEQRLADLVGERAVVAREAAREVAEVRVVAAPLAHPVEPLEDPAGDPARGLRVVVRARRGLAGRLEQGERRVLVLGDRRGVGGPAAEPRDRLGAVQRARDRRAPVAGVGEDLGRQRERRRPQPRDPATCSSNATTASSASSRSRVGRRSARWPSSAPACRSRSAARRGAGGCAISTSAPIVAAVSSHDRSPTALGSARSDRRDRHDRDERVVARGEDDGHRLLAAGPRERELALGAGELVAQQGAQPGDSLAGRGRAAGLLERRGERVHALERRAAPAARDAAGGRQPGEPAAAGAGGRPAGRAASRAGGQPGGPGRAGRAAGAAQQARLTARFAEATAALALAM